MAVVLGACGENQPMTPATKLQRGKLGNRQAEIPFTTGDFRFTLGTDSAIYAYCMKVPHDREILVIRSLGQKAGRVGSVSLLGSDAPLEWRQTRDALIVRCPTGMDRYRITATFRVEVGK